MRNGSPEFGFHAQEIHFGMKPFLPSNERNRIWRDAGEAPFTTAAAWL